MVFCGHLFNFALVFCLFFPCLLQLDVGLQNLCRREQTEATACLLSLCTRYPSLNERTQPLRIFRICLSPLLFLPELFVKYFELAVGLFGKLLKMHYFPLQVRTTFSKAL